MIVPFNNLTPNKPLLTELTNAFEKVMESGWFINGPEVEAFEREWADYTGSKYCIGVSSGQAALELLLKAHGIGYGDEVIVPSWTAVPTWKAVLNVGAMVRPIDVDYDTMLLQPEAVMNQTGKSTKAIVPVHLYGYRADTNYGGWPVINDACQAHGLKKLGNAAWSFYPTKNLGGYGDGGAITTNDLCNRIIYKRDSNRLDELQAAFLRVRLRHLDNNNRWLNAEVYNRLLPDTIRKPALSHLMYPCQFHQYVIRTSDRDNLQAYLKSKGIQTLIHYPTPPHRLLGLDFDLPVADRLSQEVLSLPITCSQQEVEYVSEMVNQFFEKEKVSQLP